MRLATTMFYCCSIIFAFIRLCHALDLLEGWNNINLHCRDSDNKPVDWWYLYKPPSGTGPDMDKGSTFLFITPETVGRWQPSATLIDFNSMLLHTLSPLYRKTNVNYLAMVAYTEPDSVLTSSGDGVMMADELGGVWMSSSVPGLIDLSGDRPMFPVDQLETGHLVMCMSLDLPTLNEIGASLRAVSPKLLRMRVPNRVRSALPDWQHFARREIVTPKPVNFLSKSKTIRGVMIVRRPREKRCLYKEFAKAKGIVLDVYGHDTRTIPFCEKSYGVRNIDSISLKYPESVYYIDNSTDRAGFAVSTAAHWQRKGDGSRQYWTCISYMGMGDADVGGLIVCVENYNVWWSFDNMKVKEPSC